MHKSPDYSVVILFCIGMGGISYLEKDRGLLQPWFIQGRKGTRQAKGATMTTV